MEGLPKRVCSARHVIKLCRSGEGSQSGSVRFDASVPACQFKIEATSYEENIAYEHCVVWLISSFMWSPGRLKEDLRCALTRSNNRVVGDISSHQLDLVRLVRTTWSACSRTAIEEKVQLSAREVQSQFPCTDWSIRL